MKLLSCVLFLAAIFTAVYASDEDAAAASAVPIMNKLANSKPVLSSFSEVLRGKVGKTSVTYTNKVMKKNPKPNSGTGFQHTPRTFDINEEQMLSLLELIDADPHVVNEDVLMKILKIDRSKAKKGHTPRVTGSPGKDYPVATKQNTSYYLASWAAMIKVMSQNQFQPACTIDAERTQLKARIAELESMDRAKVEPAETISDVTKQLEALEKKNKDLEAINQEAIKQKTQAIIEKTQAIDRIAAAEREKTEALTAKENLAKSLADLEKKFNAAEVAIKQANAEKEAEKKRADEETQRAEQLQLELAELRRTSEEAVRQVHAEKEAARQRDHAGEEEKRRLQNELEAAMRRMEVAETARDSTERNAADLRILQDRLEEANQRAAAAETAIQGEQVRLDAVTQRAAVLAEENTALQGQVRGIAVLNADIAQLRRDLQITQQVAARVPGLQERIDRMQVQLNGIPALERSNADLQRQFDEGVAARASLEAEVQRLQARIRQLEAIQPAEPAHNNQHAILSKSEATRINE